jgi:hypothetical protein
LKASSQKHESSLGDSRVSSKVIVGLIATSVACALLGVFQWMELIVAQSGAVLSCSINETVNCVAVWNAPFAKSIHAFTSVPVAGWGLIWSLGALWAALRVNTAGFHGREVSAQILSVRLFAVAAVLSSLILGAVSFQVGAICITCIATYWLVLSYAVCAFLLTPDLLPKDKGQLLSEILKAGAAVLVLYILLLYPGTKTPQKTALALDHVIAKKPPTTRDETPESRANPTSAPTIPKTVDELVDSFPPQSRQAFSDALARIRIRDQYDVSAWPVRFRKGSPQAAAKLVEFTDIKCGHCARLVMELKEIERLVPPGLFSIEPRQFPLDYECNKSVDPQLTDRTGVRCAAARSLICLEGQDSFWDAQLDMFKIGPGLTKKKVLEIGGKAAQNEKDFHSCVQSKQTQNKIDQDVAYAMKFELKGTPLVLINRREVDPIGALLFGMILSGGDLDAPAFRKLPAPSPDALKDPHAGHGH